MAYQAIAVAAGIVEVGNQAEMEGLVAFVLAEVAFQFVHAFDQAVKVHQAFDLVVVPFQVVQAFGPVVVEAQVGLVVLAGAVNQIDSSALVGVTDLVVQAVVVIRVAQTARVFQVGLVSVALLVAYLV